MDVDKLGLDSTHFDAAVRAIETMTWHTELEVERIGSPQRIAPYSIAISADIVKDNQELGTGRLILLHDPRGDTSWQGTFRCVSFIKAGLDLEMATDPAFPDVGWSWLLDALEKNSAPYLVPSGTITAAYSRGYGEIADPENRAEVEFRASWTPLLSNGNDIIPHLRSWEDLIFETIGLPILPDGLVMLSKRQSTQKKQVYR